jgi:hypothetical protein
VKIALQDLKAVFTDSPMAWLSLITCLWLFVRAVIYRLQIASSRPSLLELTLVALIGGGAAVVALLRDNEQAWYIGVITLILNAAALWYAISQLEWGYLYES